MSPCSPSFTSPLTYLNIDLQNTGINLSMLDSQLLSHLPKLQSLVYHSYGKSHEDINDFIRFSNRLKRFQFIRKGLSAKINILHNELNNDLVSAVQDINNSKNPRQSLTLHSVPYPDKVLYLPFTQWNKVQTLSKNHRYIPNEGNRLLDFIINELICKVSV